MGSYYMYNGISQYIRDAVTQINKVGVANLREYCKRFHPKCDFDKAMLYIRYSAHYGYANTGRLYGVSARYVQNVLQRYHQYAKEAEQWQERS